MSYAMNDREEEVTVMANGNDNTNNISAEELIFEAKSLLEKGGRIRKETKIDHRIDLNFFKKRKKSISLLSLSRSLYIYV